MKDALEALERILFEGDREAEEERLITSKCVTSPHPLAKICELTIATKTYQIASI